MAETLMYRGKDASNLCKDYIGQLAPGSPFAELLASPGIELCSWNGKGVPRVLSIREDKGLLRKVQAESESFWALERNGELRAENDLCFTDIRVGDLLRIVDDELDIPLVCKVGR